MTKKKPRDHVFALKVGTDGSFELHFDPRIQTWPEPSRDGKVGHMVVAMNEKDLITLRDLIADIIKKHE